MTGSERELRMKRSRGAACSQGGESLDRIRFAFVSVAARCTTPIQSKEIKTTICRHVYVESTSAKCKA